MDLKLDLTAPPALPIAWTICFRLGANIPQPKAEILGGVLWLTLWTFLCN